MTDPLNETAIRKALREIAGEKANGAFTFHFPGETKSTNDDAKQAGVRGQPEGTVIVADHQTAGRGRRENRWESPPGRNLLFSMVLRPTAPIEQWTRIPHLIGLAVAMGIESVLPEMDSIQLKWPNDLMLSGRKLGGILVESQLSSGNSFCVAGVGLNVNIRSEEFSAGLESIGVSLHEMTGQILSRSIILAHILAEWNALYPVGIERFETIRDQIEARSFLAGHEVDISLNGETTRGEVIGIGPDGELLLHKSEQIIEIRAADRVRRIDV